MATACNPLSSVTNDRGISRLMRQERRYAAEMAQKKTGIHVAMITMEITVERNGKRFRKDLELFKTDFVRFECFV